MCWRNRIVGSQLLATSINGNSAYIHVDNAGRHSTSVVPTTWDRGIYVGTFLPVRWTSLALVGSASVGSHERSLVLLWVLDSLSMERANHS